MRTQAELINMLTQKKTLRFTMIQIKWKTGLRVYSNAVHVRKITGVGHGVHRTFRKPKIAEEERNCQKMHCKSEKSTCA